MDGAEKKGMDYALMQGMRMARLGKGWIGVGYHSRLPHKNMAQAAMEGVVRGGADLLELGEVSRPVFQFGLAITGCRGGIYLSGGTQPVIQLVGELGLPLSRREESLLRTPLSSELQKSGGRWEKPSGLWELYCSRLEHLAGGSLAGSRCVLRCGDAGLQRQAREVLDSLGCHLLDGPLLWLNNTGERLAAFTPLGDIIPYPQLLSRACGISFAHGRPVALPEGILPEAEKLGDVRRYSLRPRQLTADQRTARELAARQLWERDGLMLAVLLLAHQQQGSLDLMQGQRMWHNDLAFKDYFGKS